MSFNKIQSAVSAWRVDRWTIVWFFGFYYTYNNCRYIEEKKTDIIRSNVWSNIWCVFIANVKVWQTRSNILNFDEQQFSLMTNLRKVGPSNSNTSKVMTSQITNFTFNEGKTSWFFESHFISVYEQTRIIIRRSEKNIFPSL